MALTSLIAFISIIWLMILAVAGFLVLLVPVIHHWFKGEKSEWPLISLIQGVIAIVAVLLFIIGLSKLKGFYAARKLHL